MKYIPRRWEPEWVHNPGELEPEPDVEVTASEKQAWERAENNRQ